MQHLVAKRLVEKFNHATLHGGEQRRYVAVTGDEDERQVNAVFHQLVLEF